MKITTWNVNSLTARLQHVLDWTAANPVDVLCLQELKLTDDKFPLDALRAAGYAHCAVFGQKTYNGVAVMSRLPLRDTVKNIVGFEDDSSRLLSVTVDAPDGPLRLVNGYFVNGQAPGSEKFAYKMAWLRGLRDYLQAEIAQHPRLVLVGDFNIAPEDRDSFDPVGLKDTIHHTTEEREHFRALLDLGLVDAFRLFDQPDKSFSWWDYRMLGYQKNRGLRTVRNALGGASGIRFVARPTPPNARRIVQPEGAHAQRAVHTARMPRYLRNFIAGGTYFFTVTLADRRSDLLVREIDCLRQAYALVRQRHPFETVAICVLPDHLHAVWKLPPGDANVAMRWSLIKHEFSMGTATQGAPSASQQRRRERGIWQRRYWEHQIRDEDDLARHVDYVHFNPVKHGLVATVADWRFSSFHRWVKRGDLPAAWGLVQAADSGAGFGERGDGAQAWRPAHPTEAAP